MDICTSYVQKNFAQEWYKGGYVTNLIQPEEEIHSNSKINNFVQSFSKSNV